MSNLTNKPTGIPYIVGSTKYPTYIRNHAVFTQLNKINKVFTSIGLPNMSEECSYSNVAEAKQMGINLLYYNIRGAIATARDRTTSPVSGLLSAVMYQLNDYYTYMVQEDDGSIAIKMYRDCGVEQRPATGRRFSS